MYVTLEIKTAWNKGLCLVKIMDRRIMFIIVLYVGLARDIKVKVAVLFRKTVWWRRRRRRRRAQHAFQNFMKRIGRYIIMKGNRDLKK